MSRAGGTINLAVSVFPGKSPHIDYMLLFALLPPSGHLSKKLEAEILTQRHIG